MALLRNSGGSCARAETPELAEPVSLADDLLQAMPWMQCALEEAEFALEPAERAATAAEMVVATKGGTVDFQDGAAADVLKHALPGASLKEVLERHDARVALDATAYVAAVGPLRSENSPGVSPLALEEKKTSAACDHSWRAELAQVWVLPAASHDSA